jgi:hypothetical protein
VPTPFAVPANNVVALVGPAGYVAGSGTLTLAAGQGAQFPALSGLPFYRLTVIQQAHAYDPLALPSQFTIYKATGRSGDTFTGLSAIEGTTDRAYVGGDVVDVRVTAGTVSDVQVAINNLETRNAAICQGRLTIISGDPTGITAPPSQAPSSLLYFTPFRGNLIALYNGSTGWDLIPFAETSIGVPSGLDTLYDVLAYNNSGTLALTFSAHWSNTGNSTGAAGVRAESLASQDGIYVWSADHRYRYLGTIFASSGGQTIDRPGGLSAVGQRCVWNYYNRLARGAWSQPLGSWTYGSTTFRPFNNNAGSLGMISIVTGIQEDFLALRVSMYASLNATSYIRPGIGFDAPSLMTGSSTSILGSQVICNGAALAEFETPTSIGLHTYFGLESVAAGPSVTVYGDGTSYIKGTHWC